MKRFIFIILLTLLCVNVYSQTYTREGNNFVQIIDKPSKVEPIKTQFTWTEKSTNKQYPIFISSTGSCFIKKVSKKTGKEYRSYLNAEISKEICKELNIEYKNKSKSN